MLKTNMRITEIVKNRISVGWCDEVTDAIAIVCVSIYFRLPYDESNLKLKLNLDMVAMVFNALCKECEACLIDKFLQRPSPTIVPRWPDSNWEVGT